jgi:hypothetical protein
VSSVIVSGDVAFTVFKDITGRLDFSAFVDGSFKGLGEFSAKDRTIIFNVNSSISSLGIFLPSGNSFNNVIIRPSIIKGSVAPTTWSQGYNGLKHTHITGLKTTGINLWDEETEQGSIDNNGNNIASTTSFRSKNFITIKPNENYMLHYGSYSSSSVIYYYFYDINKNFISSPPQRIVGQGFFLLF